MTIQIPVIASEVKQSRVPDNVQINNFVIISAGHVRNPLQKRLMTIQVAVIASGAKQSRKPDNVWFNNFVIISPGHGKPPQKRVMTIQVAVIATARWLLSEAMH